MEQSERVAGLRAVLGLVQDGATCLNRALAEVKIRAIPGTSWAVGSLGTAHAAVQFSARMIQAAINRPAPPAPKGLGS